MPKTLNQMTDKHTCEFCQRSFHNEKNLINHLCEKKRRWFDRDEPYARLAFMSWTRFYELNSRLKKAGTKRTFKEFMDSKYYIAFSKFGRHLIDLNVVSPAKFIDYVIKNSIPLDKWRLDSVYELYMAELVIKESPEDALARNIELFQTWSKLNGDEWTDFFRKVSPFQAAGWVKNGRLSPWVLYNADSAEALIDRCSPEQIDIITTSAKLAHWKIRFLNNTDSANWIRQTLREVGM